MKTKIYLSGPVSGLEEAEAKRRFNFAAQTVLTKNVEVVNPMENGLSFDAPWIEHMERDVKDLMSCDVLLLLPGWEESKGARIERAIAEKKRMLILEFHHQELL